MNSYSDNKKDVIYPFSNKINESKLVYFMAVNNILLINLICFPILIDNYRNSAWQILIILIFFSILLTIPFKGFPNRTNLLKRLKETIPIRYSIIAFLVIEISLIAILVSQVINKYFIFDTNIIIIYTFILATAIIISKQSFKKILNLGTLFFILIIPFYIIPFNHMDERMFSLLLPFDLDFSKMFYILMILSFPLEHILFSLLADEMVSGFSRKTLVLSNVFEGLYLLFIIIDAITLMGANFYVDMRFSGIYRWQVYQGNKFIENFDIFLLIIIIITVIFKLSFFFNILKKMLFIKSTKKNYFLIFLFFFICSSILYIYINKLSIITDICMYICFTLIAIIYTYLCYLSIKIKKKGLIYD